MLLFSVCFAVLSLCMSVCGYIAVVDLLWLVVCIVLLCVCFVVELLVLLCVELRLLGVCVVLLRFALCC